MNQNWDLLDIILMKASCIQIHLIFQLLVCVHLGSFCFRLSPGLLLLLLYNCRWGVSPSPRLLDVSVKSLINFHMSSRRFVNTRVLTLVREMELQLDCDLWLDANLVLKRFIIIWLPHEVNYLDNVAFCWEIKYQDNSALRSEVQMKAVVINLFSLH